MVIECAYELLDQVSDNTPEWMAFYKMVIGKWAGEIALKQIQWDKYVRQFRGKAEVPKRDYFQNRRSANHDPYFRN